MSTHLPTRWRADVPWSELAGLRIGLVLWGGLAAVDVGRATAAAPYAEISAVTVLVAVASIGMGTSTGIVAAVVGWLVVDGFVEHRYGVLGYDPVHDTIRLLLLVALSLAVTTAGRSRTSTSTGPRR